LVGQFRGQKSLGPLKMFREMAHKVIVPPKKNYVPKFLKQRDIGNFMYPFGEKYWDVMVERPHSIRGGPGSIPGRRSSIFGIWREVL
jgi:hypothetical protein